MYVLCNNSFLWFLDTLRLLPPLRVSNLKWAGIEQAVQIHFFGSRTYVSSKFGCSLDLGPKISIVNLNQAKLIIEYQTKYKNLGLLDRWRRTYHQIFDLVQIGAPKLKFRSWEKVNNKLTEKSKKSRNDGHSNRWFRVFDPPIRASVTEFHIWEGERLNWLERSNKLSKNEFLGVAISNISSDFASDLVSSSKYK